MALLADKQPAKSLCRLKGLEAPGVAEILRCRWQDACLGELW